MQRQSVAIWPTTLIGTRRLSSTAVAAHLSRYLRKFRTRSTAHAHGDIPVRRAPYAYPIATSEKLIKLDLVADGAEVVAPNNDGKRCGPGLVCWEL